MEPTTLGVPQDRLRALQHGIGRVLAGTMDEEGFKPLRLSVGGHRQRGGAGYMLRIRVPGGRLSVNQWLAAADVAAAHAKTRRVHVTLRQDLQLYDLDLEGLGAAVASLRRGALTTYASGGNTLRNITCAALADLGPGLPFDPYPYAVALSARLSRTAYFGALPRKFKIGFSGTGTEAAQAWLNDLGFSARMKDGHRGFRAMAGGGLGASPQNALELFDFLPADELGPWAEAVLDYFREASPRDQPAANRFKHILRAQGVAKVRAEVERRRAGRPPDRAPSPSAPPTGACLWVEAPQGDLNPDQMKGLGAAVKAAGLDGMRLTFDQRIVVPGVDPDRSEGLLQAAREWGLSAFLGRREAPVVVCAGPDTCNRGLVHSRELARALGREGVALPVELHISGCQNGCSQHLISPVGLQGTVQGSSKGRIPAYVLRVGLPTTEMGLEFGPALATLPARRVPLVLRTLVDAWRGQTGGRGEFHLWLHEQGRPGVESILSTIPAGPAEEVRCDWGSDRPFEVALGGSECH